MFGGPIAHEEEPDVFYWAAITIGGCTEGPDGKRLDGEPMTAPLVAPMFGGVVTLPHRAAWDHDPSEEEKTAATPPEWHDDDCPCPMTHPEEVNA
jgi:hypothetical protein